MPILRSLVEYQSVGSVCHQRDNVEFIMDERPQFSS